MSQSEDEEDAFKDSTKTMCEECESQTENERYHIRSEQKRAESPEPSCVSVKSSRSMDYPMDFRQQDLDPKSELERAESPGSSCVSMKSDRSMDFPLDFREPDLISKPNQKRAESPEPSCVSMKSDSSMNYPLNFRQQDLDPKSELERAESPEPSCVSVKSDSSMNYPLNFRQQDLISKPNQKRAESPEPSCVSMRSSRSMDYPMDFRQQDLVSHLRTEQKKAESPEPSWLSKKSDSPMDFPLAFRDPDLDPKIHQETSNEFTGSQTDLDCTFMVLEEKIAAFVKAELKKFRSILSWDESQGHGNQCEDEELLGDEEEEWKRRSKEAFLMVTLQFMRGMKKDELANSLKQKTLAPVARRKLKSNLKEKFTHVFEGIANAGHPTLLNQIYTELHITEEGAAESNEEHEVRQIETASQSSYRPETTIRCLDIFKASILTDKPIKRVLTKGVAGIGKTVLTQKFTLDWAEDKHNQDIEFTFPFTFRELNVLKERKFSLVELVQHFFAEIEELGICKFEEFKVLVIFDGLDECRLPLDFHNNEILTDVTESKSLDVLLTNIIGGKLLPSALIWITTRPAAANQIPAECVDMVTEVRGFTDPQKEEYVMKRFRDKEQASRILSHIKTSPSLYTMCHIPVFCWITATVLENVLKSGERGGGEEELPKTLTALFIHFLVVQAKLKNVKYDGRSDTDPHWNPQTKKMIESLGKLAFEQLQKPEGNLIFYESDLLECGIDIRAASVYSGVFTQICKKESGLYQAEVFTFVHLSVHEFLAALHVHLTYVNSGINLLSEERSTSMWPKLFRDSSEQIYKNAVDKALESPNGHLDLFLRFFLGLSLQTNQDLLRGRVPQTGSSSSTNQKTIQYVKQKISEGQSTERSINLFHCLNELNDSTLVEEIQQNQHSRRFSMTKLSPAHWSALVFILLSSGKDLDVFDLKKYSASDEVLLKLLPVVKASTKAQLSCCNLSERSCEALSTVLCSSTNSLRELDLSNNDLQDSGVERLCVGLHSPHCRLEVLRLSGCLITMKGCASLASALKSNPSSQLNSHLLELDLSYNHPKDTQVFSSVLADPTSKLKTVRLDHGGSQSLKPGLKKYACKLTLDQKTAHRQLVFSDSNRKITVGTEKQSYPDNQERFDHWKQLLTTHGLDGRCYWEVQWTGQVYIAVTYKGIKRKGQGGDCCLGSNDQSWSLMCSDKSGFSVLHANESVVIPSISNRVGVYLDWPAGTLSFYKVYSDRVTHIHTFSTTFTEPLYPAFRIRADPFNSSVSLCKIG